jgi:hypothetical protein
VKKIAYYSAIDKYTARQFPGYFRDRRWYLLQSGAIDRLEKFKGDRIFFCRGSLTK